MEKNSNQRQSSNNKNGGGGSRGQSGNSNVSPHSAAQHEPTLVSGWENWQHAQNNDRYQYIGKDEDTGEPEFLDYGPKSARG